MTGTVFALTILFLSSVTVNTRNLSKLDRFSVMGKMKEYLQKVHEKNSLSF